MTGPEERTPDPAADQLAGELVILNKCNSRCYIVKTGTARPVQSDMFMTLSALPDSTFSLTPGANVQSSNACTLSIKGRLG